METEAIARPVVTERSIGLGKLVFRWATLRQGGWMLAIAVATGVINYLSNAFVGRRLGPADYSIFAAMVSLSIIIGVVTGIVQTVITNYVASLRTRQTFSEASALLMRWFKRLLLWAVGGTVVLWLLALPMARLLQLPSAAPVVVMGLYVAPVLLQSVGTGGLRGLQRFGRLGWSQLSAAVFRLAAAVGFIALGWGATGAVISLPVAALGTMCLSLFFLRDVLRARDASQAASPADGFLKYFLSAGLALICFAVLTNGDVILVKSRFAPAEAGIYSAVATLGKTTFWLASAVAMLLLPKASTLHAGGRSAVGMLRKSLLAVALLCGSMTAFFFVCAPWIIETFFGPKFLSGAELLGWYGLAMAFLALVNVWVVYYLAVQNNGYAWVLLIGVSLLLTALIVWGVDLMHVVIIVLIGGAALYLAGEALLFIRRQGNHENLNL